VAASATIELVTQAKSAPEARARPPIFNQFYSPSDARPVPVPFVPAEMRMFRVLAAVLLAAVAVQLSACTGSLRLGSSVPVVENDVTTANV